MYGEEADTTGLTEALTVHGEQVTNIIDAMAAGDHRTVLQLAHEGYEHIGMVAQIIADSSSHDSDSM